jgi:predicted molibdopterin-dependent oxidoreductase YjgC
MTKEKTFTITIDNQKVEVKSGLTILEAARQANIYIPSLCAFEHLPSYGACRMCLVEVDGLRGLPTSCTTPVEEGMVIRTDSAEIKGVRQEILRLLLSEHPASCLFCGEKDECAGFQGTIRKAGMTTGCRYCANDGRCELQQITEKVGLTDTSYPVYFRNFPVEKNDPFYDRDYNLCVLCGRCVRVCNDVRMNGTLSFKQRGKQTTIGPAFDRSHLEGGCEFCGSCVGVCPTGALSVKTSKWYGKPESETTTTCPYCSIGCRLMLQVKANQVIDALSDYSSPVDHGLTCVKGRFGVPELVNSAQRLLKPRELTPMGYEDITWERAIEVTAGKLSEVSPADFLMVVSPQLTNEDIFAAQHFARQVMGTENIVSSVMMELGDSFVDFLGRATTSDPVDVVEKGEVIFAVGFDSRYGYSPLGVAVKRAVESGSKAFTLSDLDTNLDIIAEAAFKIESSRWSDFMELLLFLSKNRGKKGKQSMDARFSDLFSFWRDDIERLQQLLAASSSCVMIIGPDAVRAPERDKILASLNRVKESSPSWRTITAHPYTNLAGMAAMGGLPGIKPGEAVRKASDEAGAAAFVEVKRVDLNKRWKAVYVVGETLPEWLPESDYLIYQNAFPGSSSDRPAMILPSALFTESSGTFINYEGRIVSVQKAVEPMGSSRPEWWILSRIAEKMNRSKSSYDHCASVQTDIRKQMKGFPDQKKRMAFTQFRASGTDGKEAVAEQQETEQAKGEFPFLLYYRREQETYRGVPLAEVVSGMRLLSNRGYLLVNADDALRLGLENEATANVGWNGLYLRFPVRTSANVSAGILHLMAAQELPFSANPCAVQLRRNDE